jgi:hypothetical protein
MLEIYGCVMLRLFRGFTVIVKMSGVWSSVEN